MHTRIASLSALTLVCVTAAALSGTGMEAADAAPPGFLQGHAWENPILDGIATQDREFKRMQPQAVAGQYQRLAARRAEKNEMVRRYYLLGRAHGKTMEDLRQRATQARTAKQRQDLELQASRARDQALRAYREATALAPGCYFAYHDMGVLELQRETPNFGQATQHLTRAVQLNGRYPAPLRKLVLIYRQQKNYNAIVNVLHRLIPLAPNDVVARVTLAGALAELNRIPEARKINNELLRVDPTNMTYRTLAADLDYRSGNIDAAQAEFRRLAEANSSNPVPLQGVLRCLDWKRKNKKPVSVDDYLWVMNGMLRIESREEVKVKLREQIRSLKKQRAEQSNVGKGTGTGKPPTPEDLVKIMTGPNEEGRYKVLAFLNTVNQAPPKQLLDGVMSRLSPRLEPSARVRALAVEIVGRQLGWGWLPIARLVVAQDPDANVRIAGIDAIARMAKLDPIAQSGAVLAIAPLTKDRAPTVATAARLTLVTLGKARLGLDENASDAAHRAAFDKWWRGPVGENLQIESLRRYPDLKDPFVEDLLGRYLRDDSFFIRQAAYEAFGMVKTMLGTAEGSAWYRTKRRVGYAQFEAWIRSLPAGTNGRLTRENAAQLEPAIRQWWDARPKG